MPNNYIIKAKDQASDDDLKDLKQHVEKQGGTILHEHSLIKGFSVSFPDDSIHTLQEHPHVDYVEADSEVKTQ